MKQLKLPNFDSKEDIDNLKECFSKVFQHIVIIDNEIDNLIGLIDTRNYATAGSSLQFRKQRIKMDVIYCVDKLKLHKQFDEMIKEFNSKIKNMNKEEVQNYYG